MRSGFSFQIALLVMIVGVHWSRTGSSENPVASEPLPMMKELSKFITYDPKIEGIWRNYSTKMYEAVGLTTTEIARLNELEGEVFEYATKSLQDSINEIGDTNPELVSALQSAKFTRIGIEREMAMRDFLGDVRYEYLILAKEAFSETYEKESGRRVLVCSR